MNPTIDDDRADTAGALDLVLTGAALSQFRRFRPGWETLRLAGKLGRRPRKLAMQGTDLLREYGKVAVGASALGPAKGDRRFADSAWTDNPLLHRALQVYLANARAAETLISDAHLDYRDGLRVRFLVDNLIDATAPSNNPALSPAAWKAAIDTGGTSLLRGAVSFAKDMAASPRIPTMVEPTAFEVGRTLAVTPGAVIQRTPIYELIQYTPQTAAVRAVPLLIVPPVINKYYAIDLAPGRSLVEYLVSQGQQVFVISWRNPDARHRGWGIDAYGEAIRDGLDTVLQIADVEHAHLLALCSGGIIASMLAAYLAEAGGLDKVASLGLAVTVLDQSRAGVASALIDERVARLAVAASARRGYLDGRSLAEVFAWLRPNDLIWNYWVNNYLRREAAARLRRPVLERRHDPDGRPPPSGLHRSGDEQCARHSRSRHDVRAASRPVQGGSRFVRGRRPGRSPLSMAVLLRHHPVARRQDPFRAVQLWSHRGSGQPADQSQSNVPDLGRQRSGPRRVAQNGPFGAWQLVARLCDLVG